MQKILSIKKKKLIIRSKISVGLAMGSMLDSTSPKVTNDIPNVTFNPFKERMNDFDEVCDLLHEKIINYNWEYRKKICSKCPLDTQHKLKCQKINNFRIIDNKKIQETHCSKLMKAREQKFKNHMKMVFALNPLLK